MADAGRELPGIGEVGAVLADRARGYPWRAIGAGLFVGYLLGGGLFTRPTGWLLRAVLGTVMLPIVRGRAVRAWRALAAPARPTASGVTAA